MTDQIKWIFGILGIIISHGRCMPLKWDSICQQLFIYQKPDQSSLQTNNQSERPKLSLLFEMHRMSIIVLIGQQAIPTQSQTSTSEILNWMALIILPLYHTNLRISHESCAEIILYVNGLFRFREQMKNDLPNIQGKFGEKMNLLLALALAPASFIVPIGYVFGLHWFDPIGKKSLIGYWILGEKEGTTLYWNFLKVGVLLFNFWVWTAGIHGAILCIGGIQSLCTVSLKDCIQTFWNIETKTQNICFGKRAKIYRQVQLLSNLQTEVQAGSMMTVIIVLPTVVIALTVCLILHQPWTSKNAPVLILCGYMACLCMIALLFLIGGQAGVWSDSRKMFEMLDRLNVSRDELLGRWERKWQQRFWKSCRNLIKVKFGINNFVEEKTPLNCLNCAVSLTVQLLLLEK